MNTFRSMNENQQFRLCGLASNCLMGTLRKNGPKIFAVILPQNAEMELVFPVQYSTIGYFTPALPCTVRRRTANHLHEESKSMFIIPNPNANHSVYLSSLKETKLENGSVRKQLQMTDRLTNVSSLYENGELFEEPRRSRSLSSFYEGASA